MYHFKTFNSGFCRVYFTYKQQVYCIQEDSIDQFTFYRCTKDGEPSYCVGMPKKHQFMLERWEDIDAPIVVKVRKYIQEKCL